MVSTPICTKLPGFFLVPFNDYFNSDFGFFFFFSGLADKLRWYVKNEAKFFLVYYSVILIFSIVYTEWASVVETF